MKYHKGDYFIVPNRKALFGLDSHTQTVFMWICARADDKGQCFPSISNLSKSCGMSRPTILSRIDKLEKLGFIEKTKGNSLFSNKYQVCLVVKEVDRVVKEIDQGGKGALLGVVKEVDSNNNHKNNNHKQHKGSLSSSKVKVDEKKVKEIIEWSIKDRIARFNDGTGDFPDHVEGYKKQLRAFEKAKKLGIDGGQMVAKWKEMRNDDTFWNSKKPDFDWTHVVNRFNSVKVKK